MGGSPRELEELFHRALELPDADRAALVAAAIERDRELGDTLARMLAETERHDSLLDRSPWKELPRPEPPPARIGPYRIVGELGRGGMGRVFLAEEVTEAYSRRVALKVIAGPGARDEALRRFRDEVRILSSLDHPGIARFLHGGRAEDGTWYLALELVDGEDILTWAARRELPVRQRIELFLEVLAPVRYAHDRGVVHRDLKPSHLLVGADGRPRLLDFGISKLVDPETHASATVTRTEARALTPAYASPEQFCGEAVSPASDVYALGVVLYELLCGRRPFADSSGTAELERAVREVDPEPPSLAAKRVARDAASNSSTTRPVPAGALGRDLDAICLKALRKRPSERYVDAGALADDLERFLAGRPVAARRGSRRYRLGRFVQRHRGRLVIAAALALAVGASWVAWRAQKRADEFRPVEPVPRLFPFAGVAAIPIAELERRFAERPDDVEAGAALVLALIEARRLDSAKLIVARLRQIPAEAANPLTDFVDGRLAQEVEEPQRALVLYARSLASAIAAGRGELVPRVRATRGRLLALSARREEGLREMELAAREFEAAGDGASLANTLNDIAIERLQQGDYDQGLALLRRGIAAGKAAGAPVRGLQTNLGLVESMLGRPDRAVEPLEDLVSSQRRSARPGALGQALGVLAHVYFELGRAEEAERAYSEAIPLLRQDGETFTLRSALEAQAHMDVERLRLERAEAAIAELERRAPEAGDWNATAWIARLRGLAAAASEDWKGARRELARARELLSASGDLDQAADVDALEALCELRAGHADAARRLVDLALSRLPEDDVRSEPVVLARLIRARVEAEDGNADAARSWLERVDQSTAASTSLRRRILFLAARAAMARSAGDLAASRADLDAALAAARTGERKLDERYLVRDLATLEGGAARVEAR